jgi:mRNA interferase MazF
MYTQSYQLKGQSMSTTVSQISAWGNGLALRLTKPMAKTAGVEEGTAVRVSVEPGRIVIETEVEPTLDARGFRSEKTRGRSHGRRLCWRRGFCLMATHRSVRHAPLWVPDRGDIIYIQYNPQIGKEMPDEHSMLVISPRAFSERTSIVFGFPMTHAGSHADNPFAIAVQAEQGSTSYVLTHQPKSFDWRLRHARPHPLGSGHTRLLHSALKRFDTVFGICAG